MAYEEVNWLVNATLFFLQPSKEPADTYDTVFNTNTSGINIAATDLARSASTLFLDVPVLEFESFPLYDPYRFHLTMRDSNLLCNSVGWTVVHNRDYFADIFS